MKGGALYYAAKGDGFTQAYQDVFCRREIKYLLTDEQYAALLPTLQARMLPDEYPRSRILNLYYDTPSFTLVRRSMGKPAYKEKLRLRCYELPSAQSPAFVELKKKCGGVVYKRRQAMPYADALAYLAGEQSGGESQIFRELDWVLQFYKTLHPVMALSYDRQSLRGAEDEQLRITFDENILWRTDSLALSAGISGAPLLPPARRLMEVKTLHALPLWLAERLSALGVYPVSFSKYALSYRAWSLQNNKEDKQYA